MKALFGLVLILFFSFIPSDLFAQKLFSEGILSYIISIENTKNEKAIPGSLSGAVLTISFTKDKSRTDMMSAPGSESAIFDNNIKKGFILKEYSAQKLMITLTAANWEDKNNMTASLHFIVDNTISVIGGYTCKKATATTADGKKNYTVYYDPSVVITNKSYNNAFPQLQGLPVQYELESGNLLFKYTLTKYSAQTVAANTFEAPKTGFRVMSYEDNQQLKKEIN